MSKKSLYETIGGMETLDRVHKIFYDKLYAHPWLGKFFEGHNQESIEKRQSLFMAEKMGARDVTYYGKQPKMAHRHLFITEEMYELRHQILRDSLEEAGIDGEQMERWLRIDNAFHRQIVKSSVEEFYKTGWLFEPRVLINKPEFTPR